MNGTRRKMIQDAEDLLQQAVELLAEAGDGEETAFDNLPEILQESERGERMQEAIDTIDTAINTIDDVIDELGGII